MDQINIGVIGTGWCGGIRANTCANSPFINELHIAEINKERLNEVKAQTNPISAVTDYQAILKNDEVHVVELLCPAPIQQAAPQPDHAAVAQGLAGAAVFELCDVSSSRDVRRIVARAVKEFGRLDCAVNAAAIEFEQVPLAECDDDDFQRMMAFGCACHEYRTMAFGFVDFCQDCFRALIKKTAFSCEADLSCRTYQKSCIYTCFQSGDQLAASWLRHSQLGCC